MAEITVEEFEQAIRCEHDNIILGCPEKACPQQNAYLEDFREKMRKREAWQINEARKLVRPWAADWNMAPPGYEAD